MADAAEHALYAGGVERLGLGEEVADHLRRAAKERGRCVTRGVVILIRRRCSDRSWRWAA